MHGVEAGLEMASAEFQIKDVEIGAVGGACLGEMLQGLVEGAFGIAAGDEGA